MGCAVRSRQGQRVPVHRVMGRMAERREIGRIGPQFRHHRRLHRRVEIVDIVDTGKTLAENGMAPRELIADISSRLIVNKASMRTRHRSVRTIVDALADAVTSKTGA